jgi:hypothetical protein
MKMSNEEIDSWFKTEGQVLDEVAFYFADS